MTKYIFLLIVVLPAMAYGKALSQIPLKIGRQNFVVEVARTPEDMRQGLMFRDHLAPNRGMLFLYPTSRIISVWMKNTHIPLDILFVDKNKRIIHIFHRANPGSENIMNSPEPALYFIELLGGTCEQYHIIRGMEVAFEF